MAAYLIPICFHSPSNLNSPHGLLLAVILTDSTQILEFECFHVLGILVYFVIWLAAFNLD